MIDPLDDMSNLQVWLKPPQIGATEGQIVKTFFVAKKKKWRIIYTLPTQSDVQDMAGGKINPIIAQNPILSQYVKGHDTVEQKTVDGKTIYYRGTFTQKAAMMVSSECNVHDEVDASDPEVIRQYETRLMSNRDENQRRWYFSHPSLKGKGVDIYWEQSDKKEWFITCPHCTKEQQLSWPDNIDMDRRCYVCSICKEPLDKETIKDGKWLSTAVGPFSGYHISQLMCTWISAEKVISDFETVDSQYFWNYVLGLPYIGGDDKIEPDVVLKNVNTDNNNQQPRVIIGVDTGLPIHYVCMNKQGAFYYNTCKPSKMRSDGTVSDPYDEIEALLKHFERSIVVADQGGDLLGIRKLQAKYPGRVYLCFYRKDRKTKDMISWGDKEKIGEVLVDRNRMISMVIEHLRQPGMITLNGDRVEWETFASHFGNIYRELVIQKETTGKDAHTLYGNEYVWKRSGPDHFVHAFVYALTGMDRFAEDLAIIIKKDDQFLKGVATASDVKGTITGAQVLKRRGGIAGFDKVDF